MKEGVFDVLMYLFETYIDADEDPEPDDPQDRPRARCALGHQLRSGGSIVTSAP